MLLSLLLDTHWSDVAQVVVLGWALLLGLLAIGWWSLRQLAKDQPNMAGGLSGLAIASLILVVGWQLFPLTIALTVSYLFGL
jgi:hypothetical protein